MPAMDQNKTPETKESRTAYLQSQQYKQDIVSYVVVQRDKPEDQEREIAEYFSARQRANENPNKMIALETAIYFFERNYPKGVAAEMCRNDMAKFTAKEIEYVRKAYECAHEDHIDMCEYAFEEMDYDRDMLLKRVGDNKLALMSLRNLEREPPAVNEIRTLAESYKNQMN